MSFGSLPSVLGNGGGVAISVIGGTGLFADGTAAAPSISFASQSTTGFFRAASGQIAFSSTGTSSLQFAASGQIVGSAGQCVLQLGTNGQIALTAAGTNQNISLTPTGTGRVVLQAGVNFLVSAWNLSSEGINRFFFEPGGRTYIQSGVSTGAVSHDFRNVSEVTLMSLLGNGRMLISTGGVDSGALLQIGTNTTTSAGGMVFGTDTFLYRSAAGCLTVDQNAAFSKLRLAESGVLKVQLESANGDCFLSTETAGKTITFRTGVEVTALTLDASQNATFAGSVTAAAAANFTFSGRSYISSPADGIIRLLNNAGTDFTRLQFGGTTVGFPSLKRSGANLVVRSADDAQDAAILAYCHVSTNVAITAAAGAVSYGGTTATTVGAAGGASALPATPLGYIIVNVAGTAAKIPYYNS